MKLKNSICPTFLSSSTNPDKFNLKFWSSHKKPFTYPFSLSLPSKVYSSSPAEKRNPEHSILICQRQRKDAHDIWHSREISCSFLVKAEMKILVIVDTKFFEGSFTSFYAPLLVKELAAVVVDCLLNPMPKTDYCTVKTMKISTKNKYSMWKKWHPHFMLSPIRC